jgi:hypothetical protein
MQRQVLASAFCVSEMFEVYDAAIRNLKRFMTNADYRVSTKRTKKKNSPSIEAELSKSRPVSQRWP